MFTMCSFSGEVPVPGAEPEVCLPALPRSHGPPANEICRGIPAGYLNALEKRLAETERALFFALAEIHTGVIENNEYPTASKKAINPVSHSKAELMENWARLSLNTRDHTLAWFLDHRLSTHGQFQNAGATLGLESLENASNPSPVPSLRDEQLSPSLHSGSHLSEASPHWVPSRGVSSHVPASEYDSSYHSHMGLENLQTTRSQSHPEQTGQELARLTGLQDATVPPAGNQNRARILARDNKRTYF